MAELAPARAACFLTPMEKVPYLGHTLLRWQCGPSSFLALPEKGALLMNWHIRLGDGSVRDVLYWPELNSLEEGLHEIHGGNPILFPFCGRCFDKGELHHWRSPDGQRRPMPLHGFARQSLFRTTRLDARGFAAQLVPDAKAKEAYPFDYEFEVTYRFEHFGLACEFTLRNLDQVPIPWCAGHHFYFTLPWTEGFKRSDYLIRLPAARTQRHDTEGTGLLSPGPNFHIEERMDNPALIDTLHSSLRTNTLIFGERGRPGDVHLKINSKPVPTPETTLVTWTPDDKAPFYCIEPWMGPANAPETKTGLHWVLPGQSQNFLVEIAVK